MKQSEIDKEYLGQRLIERGFEVWFRYMFRVIEGKPFIMEEIHKGLFDIFDDIFNQSKIRININVPPRAGKTTLAKYFIVFCLTVNPKCNFIYTSFSQMLLNDIARDITNILENPIYKAMYKNRYEYKNEDLNPVDEFWREYLYKNEGKNVYSSKKIVTSQGGVILFASTGSTITGFGCFDYDTKVLTEKGFLKLGDIVENKLKIKIWSYNFSKKVKELQPIYEYIKNEESPYLEIELDNGEKIKCTPDHIFYLKNGEECRADFLNVGSEIMSNLFYLPDWNVQFFRNLLSRVVLVYNKINVFFRKFFINVIKPCFSSSLISNIFSYFAPNSSAFDITNRRICNIIIFCYFFIWPFIFCYFNSLLCVKFLKFSILVKFIISILLCCSIFQIAKTIISRIAIKMSAFQVGISFKCRKNKSMDKKCFFSAIFCNKRNPFISFFIKKSFDKFIAFFRKYFTYIRDIIIFKVRYRKIVNIVNCNHTAPSYCLTLWDNNNLFVGESQVLVHNCGLRGVKGFTGALIIDDANKPADIRSEVMRENVLRYYEETLLSRLNNPNAAIINIQQRLHLEDLSGYLITKYDFETLKKPLIVDNKCTIPLQYTNERLRELQLNSFMFSAQYQQEPIPLGGNMIKSEWFNYYSTHPEYKRIFITGDTAQKTKECNDFSVFCVWGQFESKLYLIDMLRGKWEAPELLEQCKGLVNRYRIFNQKRLSEILLEDKASGTGLIQTLKRECTIPIRPIQVDKDKVTRVDDSLPYIANGYLYLPFSKEYNAELIKECELFSRDMSHKHDDIVDNVTMAIQFVNKRRSIYEALGC